MTAEEQRANVNAAEVYRGFRIVERVQQADILDQMRQLYGNGLGLVGRRRLRATQIEDVWSSRLGPRPP